MIGKLCVGGDGGGEGLYKKYSWMIYEGIKEGAEGLVISINMVYLYKTLNKSEVQLSQFISSDLDGPKCQISGNVKSVFNF